MSTITPLAPAARSILFALAHYEKASEDKILSYLHARNRGRDAASAMEDLIEAELVERTDPAPMSAQLPFYTLTAAGKKAVAGAQDEENEWLTEQLSDSPMRNGLDMCQQITLRTIRAGAGDATKLKAALTAVGFTRDEQTRAFRQLEKAGMVEEHSWGMMSSTPPSEYLRCNGYIALDVMGLYTPSR